MSQLTPRQLERLPDLTPDEIFEWWQLGEKTILRGADRERWYELKDRLRGRNPIEVMWEQHAIIAKTALAKTLELQTKLDGTWRIWENYERTIAKIAEQRRALERKLRYYKRKKLKKYKRQRVIRIHTTGMKCVIEHSVKPMTLPSHMINEVYVMRKNGSGTDEEISAMSVEELQTSIWGALEDVKCRA